MKATRLTAENNVLWLGVDAGSVALKLILLRPDGSTLAKRYVRTFGKVLEAASSELRDLFAQFPGAEHAQIAVTGSAGRSLADLLDAPFVDEVIAQATGLRRVEPSARSMIEIGGQDTKLISLPDSANDPRTLVEFALNTSCAAGTGSFLDQQASRLGIQIEQEFGDLAIRSTNPPRVAGRCSVFAKSDMIHLQQLATPVHDILAGLCVGLARNLKSNLGGGRELPRPIALCGGVAANRGVVRAIEDVFGV